MNEDQQIVIVKGNKEVEGGCNQSILHKGFIYSVHFRTGSYGVTVRLCEDCLNRLHDNLVEVLKELPKKKPIEILDESLANTLKLEALATSLFSTLDFYNLTFKCPKCGTYHSADHKCFNCGFDHTAQD